MLDDANVGAKKGRRGIITHVAGYSFMVKFDCGEMFTGGDIHALASYRCKILSNLAILHLLDRSYTCFGKSCTY